MRKPMPLEKEVINQLYHVDNLTLKEVADKFGVSTYTIRRNMRRNGIPPKPPMIYRKGQHDRICKLLPQAKELYFTKKYPLVKVCEELGISHRTISRLFNDNGIHVRSVSESVKLAYKQNNTMGFPKGNKNPRYHGHRTHKLSSGYVRVHNPAHHRSSVNGYVNLSILVWEDTHNEQLPDNWVIHHLNGIKNDNRPVNLVAMPDRKHRSILTEKAKRIQFLELRILELEKALTTITD